MRRKRRRRVLAGALLVAALSTSCGGGDPDREALAPAGTWHRVEDGWARGVPLDGGVRVPGLRGGDRFEAVVFAKSPGVLTVTSGDRIERVEVGSPARVALTVEAGHAVVVEFSTPGALLHSARIVRAMEDTRTVLGDERPSAEAGAARTPREPRRVLLVVADTLRADAASDETMPELLAAFADGARFTHAYAPATWTLPSMASVFTGKKPTDLALPDGTLIALAPGERTLASDLAARGFHTVGISANYTVHHENGFSAGFELYFVPSVLGHGEWPDATWVLERARRALDWFPDRDLFLYLHLMDPHDPYRDHETGERLEAPSTGATVPARDVERMRAAYASEARRLSALLGEFLRVEGPFDRVVVTADHGEEFLEHGGFKHGPTVYPEVGRVPLLVRGRGVAAGAIETPVSLVDLRSYLGADERRLFDSASDVELVSFVHAPPRYSWVHESGQAVLFARDLPAGATTSGPAGPSIDAPTGVAPSTASPRVRSAAGAVAEARADRGPPGAADPIGAWLREHHPALDFVDAAGAPRRESPGEAQDAALRLARSFHGLRTGWWVLVPGGVERVHVELDGAEGGWWWGEASRVELRRSDPAGAAAGGEDSEPSALLEIEGAEPFVLVFVAGAAAAHAGASTGGGAPSPFEPTTGPPDTTPERVAIGWPDRGRPAGELEGVEETLRRLRAQGYL